MYYFHALYSLYVFSLAKSLQFILEISLKYRQDPHSGSIGLPTARSTVYVKTHYFFPNDKNIQF